MTPLSTSRLAIVTLLFCLVGCTSPRWVKANGTKQELARATTNCKVKVTAMRDGRTFMLTQSDDFKECMQGEGWEPRIDE